MNKVKPGDTVRVSSRGYNIAELHDPKIHKHYKGVYHFINWYEMKFQISNLPKITFNGIKCYPLSLNDEEVGYIDENALMKV